MGQELIAFMVLAMQLISSFGLDTSVLSPSELRSLINQQEEETKYLLPHDVGFQKTPRLIAPLLSAQSVLVVDPDSGAIFYKKQAFVRRPIASITKVMTALVVLEQAADLQIAVTVPKAAANVPGSRAGLGVGERWAVLNLLRAMLIDSGNDAAYALAYHFGGGQLQPFVAAMNAKASALNLKDTHFGNPAGFDEDDNYSTANDVLLLARTALDNQIFRQIVGTKELTIANQAKTRSLRLLSTNQLLGGYLDVTGIKTGRTAEAGQSLLSLAERDGKRVLAVVLNSPDRFQESKILLDWVYTAFQWPAGTGPVGRVADGASAVPLVSVNLSK